MAIVGPGAVQPQNTDIKPALEGVTEFEYVTIFNPLSDDFAIRVAQDVPVNMPVAINNGTGLIQSGSDVVRNYGLDLNNPEHQGKQHISNDTIIPAGGTINLKGNEAQVAVRQLVNEMIQRVEQTRLLADPTLRAEMESQIIRNRGSIQELMDRGIQSSRQQADEAIKQSNEVVQDDSAFPGLSDDPAEAAPVQERRAPGRPKKDSTAPAQV